MSMFQNSVLKSFSQDEALVAVRFAQYQKYKEKIEFIKSVKEEKYQEGFLKDIFESCLGYTLDSTNPSDFNLEREKKNERDSKKADGVIYLEGEVVGIIELKGQNTKNLDKVQQQAFWYLTQHSNAQYVIISNFDELRFYFDKSTAYEKFSLFDLTYEDFKKLHLLLSFESIKDKTPLKIKEKTANFEAEISKELYKDFSIFRNHLFENIVKNNSDIEKSTLLRLTQKLCDRIIFILFAEDRGLLTANTIKEIREEFNNQKFTDYTLYDIYKFYFNAINEGNSKLDIPKYNGGLFATDTQLDNLKIDNEVLDMEAQKLSDYDFESEVSVNILGHIFEQSLTDLEEIQSNIENIDFDKTKTKRKKDGVFYTPEYITKYIVDNTLGKMCIEKREELDIVSVEAPKNLKKLTKKEQQTKDNLETYKNWLFNLKILDPACGSGAFLNQALEYLIIEHTNLQNDLSLMGDLFAVYTVEESVLENNLYGVDINEDATEIAKLSLWLRTAKKGRPLTKLADKIKCGNSLISDKSVVDNAFVWEEEFKEVFENGGFDIIIGNPPYVNIYQLSKDKNIMSHYKNTYKSAKKKIDLYILFLELSFKLSNNYGKVSLIVPNKWLSVPYGEQIRKLLLENTSIEEIIDFQKEKIFQDAQVDTLIITFNKNISKSQINIKNKITDNDNYIDCKYFNSEKNSYRILSNIKEQEILLFKKIEIDTIPLGVPYYINWGLRTGNMNKFCSETPLNDKYKPLIHGRNIDRYFYIPFNEYVNYIDELYNPMFEELFENNKLVIRDITGGKGIKATYDSERLYCEHTLSIAIKKHLIAETKKRNFKFNEEELKLSETISEKYILSLINSKLLSTYFMKLLSDGLHSYPDDIKKLPIKNIDIKEQNLFIEKVDLILDLNKQLQETKQNFINELELEKYQKNYNLLKI